MKIIKKIFYALVIIFLFIAAASLAITYLYGDEITKKVKSQLNQYITNEIEISDYSFSIIKKFPNASVEFKHPIAYSSKHFNTSGRNDIPSDTIFAFEKIFVEFSLIDVFKKVIRIKAFHAKDGALYLLTDKRRNNNFIFWKKSEQEKEQNITINLDEVRLTDTKIIFSNASKQMLLKAETKDLTLGGAFNRKSFTLSTDFKGMVNTFLIKKNNYIANRQTEIEADFKVSGNEYVIKKGQLTVDDLQFTLAGYFIREQEGKNNVNFNISAANQNIGSFIEMLPESLNKKISKFRSEGDFHFEANIKGPLSNNASPHIVGLFGIENGKIAPTSSMKRLKNIHLKGYFSNGQYNTPQSSTIIIKKLHAELDNSTFSAKGKIHNFETPFFTFQGHGDIEAANVKDFFELDTFKTLQGRLNSDFDISFRLNQWKNIKKEHIQDILCNGKFDLADIDIQLKDNHLAIHDLDGKITLNDETTTIHELKCKINKDPVKIQGSVSRLIQYLMHPNETNLWYNGDLYSSEMNIHTYFSPKKEEKEDDQAHPFHLPERIFGKLNIQIDQLTWDSFNGRNFSGILVNKKRSIAMQSASINSMESCIRFNASLRQNDTNIMALEFNTTLKKVNIQELFKSFDNFGQKTLQAGNIEGKVSGRIDLGLHFTSQFSVIKESIVSKSSLIIENGALIDFEPMYELSKFIEVSELEDIRFETLKNTFFIRNNKLIVPEMDIHSSAFNISGSGVHHFNNHYTYHVKVLLSEILSKKARNAKKENQEFGVIEDDGVGNTSLYLTIEGGKDGTKVKYDRKKVQEVIKERFKDEKKELKSVLHEEFGWFKKDSTLKETKESECETKDFVIEWDESNKEKPQNDNNTNEKDAPEKKEEQNKKKEKKQFNIEWETR